MIKIVICFEEQYFSHTN